MEEYIGLSIMFMTVIAKMFHSFHSEHLLILTVVVVSVLFPMQLLATIPILYCWLKITVS